MQLVARMQQADPLNVDVKWFLLHVLLACQILANQNTTDEATFEHSAQSTPFQLCAKRLVAAAMCNWTLVGS